MQNLLTSRPRVTIAENSESEDGVTSDILRIAGKISRKIERKEKKRKKSESNNADDDTTNISLLACQQVPEMPTDRKRKSKQEAMSPSEKEQAAVRDSQSPVKKEKHKLNKSLVRESVTENGVKSDTVCSPRKRKLTKTETSDASSKKKKHGEDSGSVLVNSGSHSQGQTESSTSTKKKLQQHKFRFQRENFDQVDGSSSSDGKVLLQNPLTKAELWLIKAPSDLDISALDKSKVSLSDKVIELDLANQRCDVVVSRQQTELCPLLVGPTSGKLQQGMDFAGQLQIINKIDVPSAPPIPVPPRKEHPIPDTLRQRYVPFGADVPEAVVSPQKKKKRKKDKQEKMELLEESERMPKKSKKKKKMKG